MEVAQLSWSLLKVWNLNHVVKPYLQRVYEVNFIELLIIEGVHMEGANLFTFFLPGRLSNLAMVSGPMLIGS